MCPHQASRIVQIFKIQEVERQWEGKRKVEETAWTVMPRSCKNRRSIGGHALNRQTYIRIPCCRLNKSGSKSRNKDRNRIQLSTDRLKYNKKEFSHFNTPKQLCFLYFRQLKSGHFKNSDSIERVLIRHDLFHLYKVLFTFGSYNSGQIA